MSSQDEFEKLMRALAEGLGDEIAKDFEGLDKLQARVPKPITTLSGGSAMVDYQGNVVAFQVAKRPHGHEDECDPLEVNGVAVIVNGVTTFVPFRVLNEVTERVRAFAMGELEGEEPTW